MRSVKNSNGSFVFSDLLNMEGVFIEDIVVGVDMAEFWCVGGSGSKGKISGIRP